MTRARSRRQYGTGSIYQRASDGRWFGVVEAGFTRDGKRKRVTVSAKTEAAVKAKMKQRAAELGRGQTASTTTIKAWAEHWLTETERHVTPNAHETDRGAVGWIVEAIGARKLDQLTPADIRAVSDAVVTAGRSTSTARRYHGTLMRVLKAAQVEGHAVPANVLLVKARAAAVSDRTSMTIDEALAILEQASTLSHGSRWLAAFLQGMRQAECLGSTWPAVSDDALRIEWQLQAIPYNVTRTPASGFRVPDGYEMVQVKGQLHLVRPKSRAGWRVLPLVPLMSDALSNWRPVVPDSPHQLVWPLADGSPRDGNDDRAEFRAMQRAAGVAHPAGRLYDVHEARHTTATMLLALGVDEATRIAIMGHSSIASTRAYEHRDLTLIRSALGKVARELGG